MILLLTPGGRVSLIQDMKDCTKVQGQGAAPDRCAPGPRPGDLLRLTWGTFAFESQTWHPEKSKRLPQLKAFYLEVKSKCRRWVPRTSPCLPRGRAQLCYRAEAPGWLRMCAEGLERTWPVLSISCVPPQLCEGTERTLERSWAASASQCPPRDSIHTEKSVFSGERAKSGGRRETCLLGSICKVKIKIIENKNWRGHGTYLKTHVLFSAKMMLSYKPRKCV